MRYCQCCAAEEKNECVDLTGTYLVTTSPENNVVEYQGKRNVRFPPGLRTIENSSFTIRQKGCESIQIDYMTRFGYSRRDLISAVKMNCGGITQIKCLTIQ